MYLDWISILTPSKVVASVVEPELAFLEVKI